MGRVRRFAVSRWLRPGVGCWARSAVPVMGPGGGDGGASPRATRMPPRRPASRRGPYEPSASAFRPPCPPGPRQRGVWRRAARMKSLRPSIPSIRKYVRRAAVAAPLLLGVAFAPCTPAPPHENIISYIGNKAYLPSTATRCGCAGAAAGGGRIAAMRKGDLMARIGAILRRGERRGRRSAHPAALEQAQQRDGLLGVGNGRQAADGDLVGVEPAEAHHQLPRLGG